MKAEDIHYTNLISRFPLQVNQLSSDQPPAPSLAVVSESAPSQVPVVEKVRLDTAGNIYSHKIERGERSRISFSLNES